MREPRAQQKTRVTTLASICRQERLIVRGAWPNHRAAFDFAAAQREAFDAAVARGEIDVKTGMPTKDSDSSGMHLPPRGWIPPPFPMRLAVGAKLYLKQCVMSASGFMISPPPVNPVHIAPWLLMGKADAALDRALLKKLRVTHVLVCSTVLNHQFKDELVYARLELDAESVSSLPQNFLLREFELGAEFIAHCEEIGGRVLVCCLEGHSCSPAVVMAYLQLKRRMRLADAWGVVSGMRPEALPNASFRLCLTALEIKLFEGSTVVDNPKWRSLQLTNIKEAWGAEKHVCERLWLKLLIGKQLVLDPHGPIFGNGVGPETAALIVDREKALKEKREKEEAREKKSCWARLCCCFCCCRCCCRKKRADTEAASTSPADQNTAREPPPQKPGRHELRVRDFDDDD